MIYKNKEVILIQNNTMKHKVIKLIITQTTSIYFIKIVYKIKSFIVAVAIVLAIFGLAKKSRKDDDDQDGSK